MFSRPHGKAAALLILIALYAPSAFANRCSNALGWLGHKGIQTLKLGRAAAGHTGKALVYAPAYLPVRLAMDVVPPLRQGKYKEALKKIPERLWKDKWHLGVYAILAALQNTTGITHHQFEEGTSGFEPYGGEGVRVIVDAFEGGDPLYSGAGQMVYDARYKDNPKGQKVVLIKANTLAELKDELIRIGKEVGPISHVDYFGHGFPGILDMPQDWAHATSIGEVLRMPTLQEAIAQQKALDEAFLPGAKIRFTSCFTMNGGHHMDMEALGHALIGQKGGTIYGSKVQVLPNWVEFAALKSGIGDPPGWLKAWGDWVSVGNGLVTAYTSRQITNNKGSFPQSEGPFHWGRTRTVPIERTPRDTNEYLSFRHLGEVEERLRGRMEAAVKAHQEFVEAEPKAWIDARNEALTRVAVGYGLLNTPLPVTTQVHSEGAFYVQGTAERMQDQEAFLQKLVPGSLVESVPDRPDLLLVRVPPPAEMVAKARAFLETRAEVRKVVAQEREALEALEAQGRLPNYAASANRDYLLQIKDPVSKYDWSVAWLERLLQEASRYPTPPPESPPSGKE